MTGGAVLSRIGAVEKMCKNSEFFLVGWGSIWGGGSGCWEWFWARWKEERETVRMAVE
jgi:hypothetical protein